MKIQKLAHKTPSKRIYELVKVYAILEHHFPSLIDLMKPIYERQIKAFLKVHKNHIVRSSTDIE